MVPLYPRDKNPMFKNWPEIATSDASTVARWWDQNPSANVGIATGQKSRVFVLDVDVGKGGNDTYETLVNQHGAMPDTWQQITGSGGFHLFFRYPNFRVTNAAGLFPGIDIRGDGGQVVAPPSIHPDTGNRYEWDGLREIEQAPLAEAPLWLLDVLAKKNNPETRTPLAVPVKIPHGVQHHTLVSFAGMMRRLGLNAEEIYPSLMRVNELRCEKPGPAANIHAIAESMMRYRPADGELVSTATKLWRMTKAKEHEAKREEDRRTLQSVDGLSVYRSPTRSDKCVIDGVLYQGLTILAGRPKVGKSWLALQLALSVARGIPLLNGRDVLAPGHVAYFALEEAQSRTSGRMQKLVPVEDITLQNIEMVYSILPLAGGGAEQLEQFIVKSRPTLVIIDTFLAFVRQTGEKRDVLRAEYTEIDTLRKIAEKHSVAMVLIHHLRKNIGGDGLDSVAGSTGITAAADCIWTLQKQDPYVILDVVGREVEEQSLALQFEKVDLNFGWHLMGEGREVRQSQDDTAVLTLLQAEGALTPARISQLLRIDANRARTVINRLNQKSQVMRNSNGSYCAASRGEYIH